MENFPLPHAKQTPELEAPSVVEYRPVPHPVQFIAMASRPTPQVPAKHLVHCGDTTVCCQNPSKKTFTPQKNRTHRRLALTRELTVRAIRAEPAPALIRKGPRHTVRAHAGGGERVLPWLARAAVSTRILPVESTRCAIQAERRVGESVLAGRASQARARRACRERPLLALTAVATAISRIVAPSRTVCAHAGNGQRE